MTKVSVVIPVYNGATYLRECLDSILQQSLKEIEVICIDDASIDATPMILQEYSGNYNKIRIITNIVNCGAGASRNRGLDIAKGEYVIFLDSDDIFEKDMLYQAFQQIEKYDADICVFREDKFTDNISGHTEYVYSRECWGDLQKMGVFSPEDIKEIIFNIWNGWPWDKLFRKKFLLENKLRFQEIRSSEDGLFVHGALSVAKKITCLNQIYVHHRVDVATSLSNQRDDSWKCCYLYLKALKRYLIERNNFSKYKKSFINWAVDFLYWNYWSLNEQNRQKLFYLLKEDILDELGLLEYTRDEFYNGFYYWFVHTIKSCSTYNDCLIPVEMTQRWEAMLYHNKEKMEKLFRFIRTHQYRTAVWGAGVRGKTFLCKYDKRKEIIKVYDKDFKRKGEKFAGKYIIDCFDSVTCKDIDFIIVTNSIYFDSIVKNVKKVKSDISILDLELYFTLYLSFPLSLEECIF